jgi:hypothetical protein
MDDAASIREMILGLIRQNDGRLDWFEVAQALPGFPSDKVFLELMSLITVGSINCEATEDGIRFWIVGSSEPN